MPVYVFKHPQTGEQLELIQKMQEPHVYVDKKGVEWQRVWGTPNASIDSGLDGSKENFMKYTQNKKGSLGDLWDASREAKEKRVKKEGRDKVEEKFYKDFKKEKGVNHWHDK